ncbi:Papain cysteine protease family protein [Theileria equi strain WA]|uniref:Papain cysteine protease family protein n=1 Tax=Theileria equi strain WA TaxID=1537102 RepID=L1LA25_THEEQ|nr:Papain cysteine protease family protein [Theileria equi strain WA]EKX72099.1 Papain cysteine protease family protein [Theileria equi strain WA]|eukprot:XP_004831551.1 Papain cysteine protease family protein [Theileria equi strain WA]
MKFRISSTETERGYNAGGRKRSKRVFLAVLLLLAIVVIAIAVPLSLASSSSEPAETEKTVVPKDDKVNGPTGKESADEEAKDVNNLAEEGPERPDAKAQAQNVTEEQTNEQEQQNEDGTEDHQDGQEHQNPPTDSRQGAEEDGPKTATDDEQKAAEQNVTESQDNKGPQEAREPKKSIRSEVIQGKEPTPFEKIELEKNKLKRNLKPRFDMMDRLKQGIQKPVEYIEQDASFCLAKGLSKSCMQGGEVKYITYSELFYLAEMTEFLQHRVKPKFEIELLIKFKKYCAKYGIDWESEGTFKKYLYLFRKDVIQMEKHNRNQNRGYTMGYYTRLAEDVPAEQIRVIGYGNLFDRVKDGEFKHTPLHFEPEAQADEKRAIVDWREGGYVPDIKIKNKRQCTSCWMLAAAAMYEALVARKRRTRVNYSAQQLLDCAHGFDDNRGGNLGKALEYLKDHAVCPEIRYQFIGKPGICQDTKCQGKPLVKSVIKISEPTAEQHLRKHGPFVTVFDASNSFINGFRGGIHDQRFGVGVRVTALVVGFGTDQKTGNRYWIVQNAWSPKSDWGENGYFRITDGAAKGTNGIFDNAYGLSTEPAPGP